MKRPAALPHLAALALAGCGVPPPCPTPPVKVQVVKELVPVPVACVDTKDVPTVPPRVGGQVNGDAVHDGLLAASSAADLRVVVNRLLAVIEACEVKPKE